MRRAAQVLIADSNTMTTITSLHMQSTIRIDEEELYEQLKEKYDRSSDDDYEYEADVDELQKKFEFGAAIAGAAVVLAPYMMDWMRETALPWMRESALPRVKTTVRRLRDKIRRETQDQRN